MKWVTFWMAILMACVASVVGVGVMKGAKRTGECEAKGGTVLRAPNGIVCAKIERIK